MAEFFNKVKDFVMSVVDSFAEFIGIDSLYAGIILAALVVILISSIIASIVCAVKAKKRKKAALEKAKTIAESEKAKQNAIVQKAADSENAKQAEEQPTVAKEPAQAPVSAPVAQAKPEPVKPAPAPVVEAKPAPAPAPVAKPEPFVPVTVPVKEPAPVAQPKAEEPVQKEEKAPAKKSMLGKWTIELKSAGEFMSKLIASNGEVMLSSEIYSTEEGARSGIATIIKWVEEGSFVIYQDKKKNYYYKLKTSGNRLICVGEIYKSEDQCLKAVESVKRIAKTAVISKDLVEGARYVDYKPQPFTEDVKGLKGKWKVETTEDGRFSARLYASNGQLMISTEEVASKKTALNAIESVRKNSVEGNFIVDKDKFGRFYYKLRNAQKSVICIGEAYDSLDACTKALESVRRFAVNSVVVPE